MRAQPKVLIVDERTDHLELAAEALRAAGCAVTPSTRFRALAPLFTATRPDVLVVAAHAPSFDSVVAVRQLEPIAAQAVPCLYLVDAPDPILRRYCLDHGGVDAVAKPFDGGELASRVMAQVRHRRRMVRALGAGLEGRGATRDPATGTYRRRVFLELIAQERRRVERYGGEFSVAACTLSLTHRPGGPSKERRVAESVDRLRSVLRESDTLARVGLGRFAVLLPTVSDELLPPLVDRARRALQGLGVVASVGGVSFPEARGTPRELLEAALNGVHSHERGSVPAEIELRAELALGR